MHETDEFDVMFRSSLREAAEGTPQFILSPTPLGQTPDPLEGLDWGTVPGQVYRATAATETVQPFFPFLGWIRAKLEDRRGPQALAELMDQAGVYFLHKEVFSSWLGGLPPHRKEEVLVPELVFEKRMILTSLWRIFMTVFRDEPALFVIDEFQNLPPTSLEALVFFHQEIHLGRFVFYMNIQESKESPDLEPKELWARFWEVFDEHKIPLLLPGTVSALHRPARFRLNNIPHALEQVRTLLSFFCVREAKALAGRLFKIYQQNKLAWSEDEFFLLYELMGEAEIFGGSPGSAVSHWSYLLSALQEKDLTARQARMAWKISQAYHAQRDFRQAQILADKSLLLAERARDDRQIFYALFHKLLAEEILRESDFTPWRHSYRRYLTLGQELDLGNALAYWLVNPYHMDSQEYIGEAAYYHDWGIGLCEQHKNLYRLSDAYMQKGYFWTIKGDWEGVLDCYKKSEEIKISIGQTEELPYVRNGRGFFLLGIGRHEEAQDNFLQALEGLKNLRNFNEIGLTIFNLGMNSFLSGQFKNAILYLTKLLRLLINLGLPALTFHSRYEILVLMALSYYKDGRRARALETWVRAREATPRSPTVEEILFTFFMRSWIREADGDLSGALKIMNAGEEYLMARIKPLKFYAPFFFLELGSMRERAGLKDEAVKAYKKGYMETFQFPNMAMREKLHQLMNRAPSAPAAITLTAPAIDFDWIIESAKLELSSKENRRQKAELEFYRQFMALLMRSLDQKELIAESMRLLQKDFIFDGVFLFIETNRVWEEAYFSHNLAPGLKTALMNLLGTLRKMGDRVFIPDLNAKAETAETELPYRGLISLHSGVSGELQCQLIAAVGPGSEVPRESLEGLFTMIRHLTAFLGRHQREKKLQEQNHLLKTAAFKDPLTGLFNRRALQERIETEAARVRRHKNASFSVLFLDLDGFRRINRLWGHLAGDQVLRRFADLIGSLLRQEDFAARFGGDEFVLLLMQTEAEGALRAAARIQELIKDPLWYRHVLTSFHKMTEDTEWPWLTCSIGAAELTPGRENKILSLADRALSEAKGKGPGSTHLISD